jgi:hypothetical protein
MNHNPRPELPKITKVMASGGCDQYESKLLTLLADFGRD